MAMRTETITWNELPADGMPDAGTTVLLNVEGGHVEEAWWDGDDWRWCESGGVVVEKVLAWADVPVGVEA